MGMEYFHCYHSYLRRTKNLTDEELGRLFRALMTYSATGERMQIDGREETAFDFIVDDIDAAAASYEETCERNRKNGRRGGRPRKRTEPTETEPNPKKPGGFEAGDEEPDEADGFDENPDEPNAGEGFYTEPTESETNPTEPTETEENPKKPSGFSENRPKANQTQKSQGRRTKDEGQRTNISIPSAPSSSEDRRRWQEYFVDAVNLPALEAEYPADAETLCGMVDVLVETMCSDAPMIRVGGEDKPREVVAGQLMKLHYEHLEYVLHCLQESSQPVKNMWQYLLTALYKAPSTMAAARYTSGGSREY